MHWGKRADDGYPTPATISALINIPLAAIDRIAHKKIWGARTSLETLPWRDLLAITMFSVVVLAVWALIFWKGGLEIH